MLQRRALNVTEELLEEFDRAGRVTEYLVQAVPAGAWRAKPPAGRGRTIAAIVSHVHSVRRTFAKMGGGPALPPMNRLTVTQAEAGRALRQINDLLLGMFQRSIARGDTRVKGMPRRSVNMMVYLIQHDAHHRGQITTLIRDLDHELTGDDVMRIWGWKKLP